MRYALALLLTLFPAAQAWAAWPVIDYSNLAQAISQVNKLSEQISKQVQMINQNSQMITLDQQMLAKFTSSYLGQIMGVIDNVDTLIQSASGLTYDLSSINTAFENSYRQDWGTMSTPQLIAKRGEVRNQLLDTVRQAMEIQSRVTQDMATNKSQIQSLVTGSQNAQGQTEAIQAGNQMLAQIAGELVEIHAMLASHAKATEAALGYQIAEEERARELGQRSMINQPVTDTPVGNPFPTVP